MKKTNSLKVAGYLSVAFGILIILDYNFWGSLPLFINAYFMFKYLNGELQEKEIAVVFAIIMFLINLFVFLFDDTWALIDTIAWIYFIYVWNKN